MKNIIMALAMIAALPSMGQKAKTFLYDRKKDTFAELPKDPPAKAGYPRMTTNDAVNAEIMKAVDSVRSSKGMSPFPSDESWRMNHEERAHRLVRKWASSWSAEIDKDVVLRQKSEPCGCGSKKAREIMADRETLEELMDPKVTDMVIIYVQREMGNKVDRLVYIVRWKRWWLEPDEVVISIR